MTVNAKGQPKAPVMNPGIFRAYDIRGIVGQTLHVEHAYDIARALAAHVIDKTKNTSPRIALGRDGRLSSPALYKEYSRGLIESGVQVVDVGIGPTPMLYFAVKHLGIEAGVMITGSHNPKEHNGFKMMLAKETLYGDDIQKLKARIDAGQFHAGKGGIKQVSVQEDYIQALLKAIKPGGKALKVAWDPGNGAAGEVTEQLVKRLKNTNMVFNEVVDGNFPNHHPDPSEEENLEELISVVKKEGYDLGIAFDGDGDRVGVVDGKGRMVWNDQLLVLWARDVLQNHKGATVIADVKASKMLFDEVKKAGGKPLVWKTGHSLIKAKMAEEKALLAGEMSGHIFFADEYYGFDDGIYAALRLLNYLAHQDKPLAAMIDALPQSFSTPEIRLECAEERKFAIVDEIKASMKKKGANISDIDGVRIDGEKGWWLVRASNTQAALSMRVEGVNQAALAALKNELKQELAQCGVTLKD